MLKHILPTLIGVLGFVNCNAQAELWKCSGGVYKNTLAPGEKCVAVEVKAGVKCLKGKRLIGEGAGSGAEKCPEAAPAVKTETRPFHLEQQVYNKQNSELGPPSAVPDYHQAGSHSPTYDRIMEEDRQQSQIDWEDKTKIIEEGGDPFPGISPECMVSGNCGN